MNARCDIAFNEVWNAGVEKLECKLCHININPIPVMVSCNQSYLDYPIPNTKPQLPDYDFYCDDCRAKSYRAYDISNWYEKNYKKRKAAFEQALERYFWTGVFEIKALDTSET